MAAPTPSGPPPEASSGAPRQPLGTNGAPVPELNWHPCPQHALQTAPPKLRDQYQCATVRVPLSYRQPHGDTIELALGRLPAADPANKIGTIFYNPGGPGGSGRFPPKFSAKLHKRFDIVGFDPRGTNASSPIHCATSAEQAQELFGQPFPTTPRQRHDFVVDFKRATKLCARNGEPLLSHMSTANVARDMDLLRQAVGDDKLTYVGYSYGSYLGEVYANLFPDRVRALLLDGVFDPIEWTTGRTPASARTPSWYRNGSFRGAHRALHSFLTACAGNTNCAFSEADSTATELHAKYNRLLDRLRAEPARVTAPAGGTRSVTYQQAVYAILLGLYNSDRAPYLADTLQQLYEATTAAGSDVPPPRVRLLSAGMPRGGRYQGGFVEWSPAVYCLDTSGPRNPRAVAPFARFANAQSRGFGPWWVYLSQPCTTWPVTDPDRYTGPWNRDTANPILLIGNRRGDPATPYTNARAAAGILADARLLTVDTYGHTAAFRGLSTCVDHAAQHYLLTTELPPPGTVCQPDHAPFEHAM